MPLKPGDSIDHYRIEAFVGAGSMGDVYKATDASLGRPVALKILSDRHRDNDELRQRFEREARAVAACSHLNVVQVFTTSYYDKRPYLAMEFLDGIDLATSVDRVGPWPPLPAAKATLDAARGLEAAANAGLIHRDVKPSNLVRLADGAVKVTDFGLAKPLDGGPQLTAMGVVVGTPDYIAPEQARGDAIDARVDIYALGGTLFFMLTGRPPYRTGTPSEDKYLKVVQRHLKNPVPNAVEVNPAADPELAKLAGEMMAKKREDRPRYPAVIERLQRIVSNLEAAGSSPAVPGGVAGVRARTIEPTPYVGGDSSPVALPGDGDGDDGDESAATRVRAPSVAPRRLPSDGSMAAVAQPRVSRWLVGVTVGSAVIFLVGLGLLLFGPIPRPAVAPMPVRDAAPVAPATDAAPPPLPGAPEGMIAVRGPGGAPLLAMARPVTKGEYAEVTGDRVRRRDRDEPIVNVSFDEAQAYATQRGMRLPTAAEWEAAAGAGAGAEGWRFADGLWEWTTDVAVSRQRRVVRAAPAQTSSRTVGSHRDVTFRLVKTP